MAICHAHICIKVSPDRRALGLGELRASTAPQLLPVLSAEYDVATEDEVLQ